MSWNLRCYWSALFLNYLLFPGETMTTSLSFILEEHLDELTTLMYYAVAVTPPPIWRFSISRNMVIPLMHCYVYITSHLTFTPAGSEHRGHAKTGNSSAQEHLTTSGYTWLADIREPGSRPPYSLAIKWVSDIKRPFNHNSDTSAATCSSLGLCFRSA